MDEGYTPASTCTPVILVGTGANFTNTHQKNQVANGDDIENAHKLDWVPPDKGGLSASPLPVKLYVLWCRQFYKV